MSCFTLTRGVGKTANIQIFVSVRSPNAYFINIFFPEVFFTVAFFSDWNRHVNSVDGALELYLCLILAIRADKYLT